ncbi:Hypothetical predicted protein [Mytilus galloprovincialis]|uniref:Uncharacterized protein n=1 Tax=Mytilus galloprovincialis TaxID=29158 RepID=A0A8B6H298_MYTGA|nr:Hypothetical predicted protein [Mytilus galloprovincialis]
MNKLPQPKNVEAPNLADEWKRWRKEVELYIDLTMDSEDEKAKMKMFLYLVGTQGREVYETLTFERPPNEITFLQLKLINPKNDAKFKAEFIVVKDKTFTQSLEKYQHRQEQAVEGQPGVHIIIDDILIYGEGKSEDEAIKDNDRKFRNAGKEILN